MLSDLSKGDKILTRGGLYGKVVNFQGKNNEKITIDIGSGIKVNIARTYIAGLADKSEANQLKNKYYKQFAGTKIWKPHIAQKSTSYL